MNRIGAFCGLVGVAGNVVGVAVLGNIPSAYRPGTMIAWVQEVIASPVAASTSAVGFTIGLVALAGWALVLGFRLETPAARAAGVGIAIGAVLNAAGTMAPLVLGLHVARSCGSADCVPAGLALLGMSLSLDAFFNFLLGLGLMVMGAALTMRGSAPRWLSVLVLLAGVASVPVSLQVVSDSAAALLVVAGPLWLLSVSVTSVFLWRGKL